MIKINAEISYEIEKFMLIKILGLLCAIEQEVITIDEAQIALFTPYSVSKLKQMKLSSELIKLVEEGLFLEDFESMLPNKLDEHIVNMKKQAFKLLESFQYDRQIKFKWLA